jgi:hypothetical protein
MQWLYGERWLTSNVLLSEREFLKVVQQLKANNEGNFEGIH